MKKLGISAAFAGAMCALAPAALAQTAPPPAEPPKPFEYTPWYEQKILPPPISATITFTTDYRFRGISQTSRAPGYQGSLDFEYELAPYATIFAGIWSSNINFGTAFVEIDVYGGLKGKITDQLSYTLQFVGYLYPGEGNGQVNYFEVIPSLSYDFGILSLTGGVALSPNYTGNSGFAAWPYVDVSVPIPLDIVKPYKLAAIGHFGYQAIDRNSKFGAPDYAEWAVGVGATVYGFDLQLKYVDTDLKRGQCFGGERWCSAGVVFQVSKKF
jgi:uncharacterized protein (TIGR02001 family)